MEKKISKVTLNGKTLIDVSEDTVTPETLAKDESAHDSAGETIRGVAEFGGDTTDCYKTTDPVGSDIADSDYFPFNDVSDSENPKKKTLFSTIVTKLKDTFLTKRMQNNTNELVQAASTLNLRMNTIDASKADNDVSAVIYPSTFVITDKEDRTIGRIESVVRPDGNIGLFMYVRNYDTNGDAVAQKGIKFEMNKSGELEYIVGDADRFDANLGFGYAEGTVTGTAITATITNFRLVKNGIVVLKLSSYIPANATLNINNTGAKPIYWENGTAVRSLDMSNSSNCTWLLMYDGAHFLIVGMNKAANIGVQSYVADTSGNIVINAFYGSNAFQFKYNLQNDELRWNRFINGAWHGDAILVDHENLASFAYSLRQGSCINIEENTDLNTLTTPGTYKCGLAATAATLVNCPWTSSSFKMLVDSINNNIICQAITVQNDYRGFIYRRIRDNNGNWGGWQPVISEVSYGKTIPANANINDYKDIGIYTIDTNNNAATMTNLPIQKAGKLIVMNVASNQYRIQQFLPFDISLGVIYQRTWNNDNSADTWSDWVKLSTNSDIQVKTYVGTCTTAADQQNKVATVDSDFSLKKGVRIGIKYSNSNTYSATDSAPITLNVNSTGDKQIYYNTYANPTGTNTNVFGVANRFIYYVYDGTYWVWDGHGTDNDTTNPMSLGFGIATCSTAAATVAKEATLSNYTLRSGGFVTVYFQYAVPADATLNINSRGAKVIRYNGQNIKDNVIFAGDKATFVFNGTQYDLVTIDRVITGRTLMGTCTTAADQQNKVATVDGDFVLRKGVRVGIKFSNTNTFSSQTSTPITLNVNSSGAKNIYYNVNHSGAGNTGTNTKAYGYANRVNYYVYDGTYWVWDGCSVDDNQDYRKSFYGTCSTDAATAAKVVAISDTNGWELRAGTIVGIKFTNSNTANNVTLNVNNTGAKSIYYNNAVYTGNANSVCGYANRTSYYMYNGSQWVYLAQGVTNSDTIPSAYCTTAADQAAKVASCSGYVLLSKSHLHVIISTTNTKQAALTLNVNGKGAKPIYINGSASSATNYNLPAGSYLVYYNGTNYYFRTDGKITCAGTVTV